MLRRQINQAWTEAEYDPSLAFLIWSWGCASGFTNGRGTEAGTFEHRKGMTDLVLQKIKEGNPWQADPISGKAPADWLWEINRTHEQDFLLVMDAILTHPAAPDPVTWSTRPVYSAKKENSSEGKEKPSKLWIDAFVSHSHAEAAVNRYVELGGRLDAVGAYGHGLLSNASALDWRVIEKFMAAAEQQHACITAAPQGTSWLNNWRNAPSLDMSNVQKKFQELSRKYPLATRSMISRSEEMIAVIRQAAGMRPTSTAWKRLDMDAFLKSNPEAVAEIFRETLALGLYTITTSRTDKGFSTMSFLSGKLSKIVKIEDNPALRPVARLASAFSLAGSRYEDVFSLLSAGQNPLPGEGEDLAAWLSDINAVMSVFRGTKTNPYGQMSNAKRLFCDGFIAALKTQIQSMSPEVARNLLNVLQDQLPQCAKSKSESLQVENEGSGLTNKNEPLLPEDALYLLFSMTAVAAQDVQKDKELVLALLNEIRSGSSWKGFSTWSSPLALQLNEPDVEDESDFFTSDHIASRLAKMIKKLARQDEEVKDEVSLVAKILNKQDLMMKDFLSQSRGEFASSFMRFSLSLGVERDEFSASENKLKM